MSPSISHGRQRMKAMAGWACTRRDAMVGVGQPREEHGSSRTPLHCPPHPLPHSSLTGCLRAAAHTHRTRTNRRRRAARVSPNQTGQTGETTETDAQPPVRLASFARLDVSLRPLLGGISAGDARACCCCHARVSSSCAVVWLMAAPLRRRDSVGWKTASVMAALMRLEAATTLHPFYKHVSSVGPSAMAHPQRGH